MRVLRIGACVRTPVLLAVFAICLLVACDRPPVIERIEFSRSPVPPNDTVTITAIATSPMGEPLRYYWDLVRGNLVTPDGNTAVLKTSKVTGWDSVSLRVLDSHARMAADTFGVRVANPER